jgi:hypothetical protein
MSEATALADIEHIDPILRLTRDIKQAAQTLSRDQARYLVDAYYQIQHDRIRSANQIRGTQDAGEPNAVLGWLFGNNEVIENNIRRALDSYTSAHEIGRWSKSICGIGPVLAAGLLAHIDIERASTAGQIWRFAGLDPTDKWEKGQVRPWNAKLKTLCWKIGESFVKQQSRENDFYGKLYVQRKAYEQAKNLAGDYAPLAKIALETKRWRDDTTAKQEYDAGRLPAARIHLRSQRWAVKLFLSHWHEVAYESRYKTPAPVPYVMAHKGHVDYIPPPNWPMQ